MLWYKKKIPVIFNNRKTTLSVQCGFSLFFLVVFSQLLVLTSCRIVKNEKMNEGKSSPKHIKDSNLKKGELLFGTQTKDFFFNDYLIAGADIALLDSNRKERFLNLVDSLGLIEAEHFDSYNGFTVFQKKNNEVFSNENDSILKTLRENYGMSFGPIVLNLDQSVSGALQNQLVVRCSEGVSDSTAREIFETFRPTKVHYQVSDKSYLLFFSDDKGYNMADLAKKMYDSNQVVHIENRIYRVPNEHSSYKEQLTAVEGWIEATHYVAGVESDCLINSSYIVGFVEKKIVDGRTDLNEKMKELGFEKSLKFSTNIDMSPVELFPNPNLRIYIAFKTIDNDSVSESKWDALEKEFPNWFGPLVLNNDGGLFGQLENRLELKFDSQLNDQNRTSFIEKHGGKEVFFKNTISYITFNGKYGYQLLEIAKKMSESSFVVYVSNQYGVHFVGY